jgi:DMSO/TMAO reductase YedYZ molybdopterin-dependent catalytic subunit
MEKMRDYPGLITGAIVGALLTAPVIAVLYLADQLAGLPFVPFDVLDWLARVTPGDIITGAIDFMVDRIIEFDIGETSSTAKSVEQIMGLLTMMGIGIVGGMIFFALRRVDDVRERMTPYVMGAGMGLLAGVALALISADVNQTATAEPFVQVVWILVVFTALGIGFGWVYDNLSSIPVSRAMAEAATDGAPGTVPVSASQIDRRQFLINVGGATATLTVLGAGLSLLVRDSGDEQIEVAALEGVLGNDAETTPDASGEMPTPEPTTLPNADDPVGAAPGTRPEYTPLEDHYRIDINSRPPVVDLADWRLNVGGLVAAPLAITLGDLASNYESFDQYVTLECISNRIAGSLISTTRWTGVRVRDVIEDWDIQPEAQFLHISSVDGFDEYLSLDLIREDERIMFCYAWDGQPLLRQHGFPLRIYIPDRYGMKQPKWISDIEAVSNEGEGYWVRRNWSPTAIVRTTSVIDTVATDARIEDDGTTVIPIGGIAYAGAKGISRVEVQIGDGEWQDAEVRTPLSGLTWVVWRYDWAFESGSTRIQVRCYDGNGRLQITENNDVRPDGATGIHSRRVNVEA